MKLKIFFVLTILCAFAACKTTYKATDRPTSITDSTSSTTDSMSSSIKRMPITTDSTRIPSKIDSIKVPSATDSTKMPSITDSTKVSSKTDSIRIPSITDSTKVSVKTDSIKMQSPTDSTKVSAKTDSLKMPSATDSTKVSLTTDSTKMPSPDKTSSTSVSVPAGTQTAFTTQYPGATNVVWAKHDSLAAVPIDLRMAGWKRMDAEDFLVKFDLNNENYYAWYDSDGNWVGSAYTMKDPAKLPAAVSAAVKNAVKTKYPGYSITNVNREFQKNKKAYEIELKKDDNTVRMLVNSDGKIIKVLKYVKK